MSIEGDDFSEKEEVAPHEYSCGLVSGECLHVKKVIRIEDHTGRKVGEHPVGEEWLVIRPGINVATGEENISVIWLKQPDGEVHTWDDDSGIFEYFERAASG